MPDAMQGVLTALFWSVITIGCYVLARIIAKRFPAWWSSPLLLAPIMVGAIILLLHAGYASYIKGTHWLALMMGPATVAFAIPLYEHRETIKRHWPVLLAGVAIGSTTAIGTAFALAYYLDIPAALRTSLLPRSTSTPFAMAVSSDLGGMPELTAVFVIITGVTGAAFGEFMLRVMPLRSSLARGAFLGMGAHGAGVAKAHQIGAEEGSIAGLVMILAGCFNLMMAPVVALMMT
ncbi:murein hydrolase effector protein LrgB [Azorhizobium oxalatiphilum]|uniref:Murein hydrolase effector protein LrgB n=1 Tax=Azorhizobium oxalatiphilum TaxID=980631 RepID=A0A917BWZ5_9HYPH|nr:LrgB family protein [Azorhizobium oxalatiphilum]GGF59388.1 murein hydrolase effector protein LrgB [Azorhizobium oxalatiphilum]